MKHALKLASLALALTFTLALAATDADARSYDCNEARSNGDAPTAMVDAKLKRLGDVNGCLDRRDKGDAFQFKVRNDGITRSYQITVIADGDVDIELSTIKRSKTIRKSVRAGKRYSTTASVTNSDILVRVLNRSRRDTHYTLSVSSLGRKRVRAATYFDDRSPAPVVVDHRAPRYNNPPPPRPRARPVADKKPGCVNDGDAGNNLRAAKTIFGNDCVFSASVGSADKFDFFVVDIKQPSVIGVKNDDAVTSGLRVEVREMSSGTGRGFSRLLSKFEGRQMDAKPGHRYMVKVQWDSIMSGKTVYKVWVQPKR